MQIYKIRHQYRYSKQFFISISLLLLFLFAACDSGSSSSAPTSQQLISKAQDAIRGVKSYHFKLTTDNPGTGGGSTINVKDANGDILTPDKLKATATALLAGFAVQTQIVAIADKQYYQDPITAKWTQTTGLLDPRALSNPQTGVAALLGQLQNPTAPVDSNSDGRACWSIDGKLDTKYLTGITGGGTPAGSTVATTICVGKSDNFPYLIRIKGVAVQGDLANTTRTFVLSNFNEALTIVAPI